MESQNRRNFLKSSSLAGTTLLASSTMGIFSIEKEKDTFNEYSGTSKKNKHRTIGTGKHSLKVNSVRDLVVWA